MDFRLLPPDPHILDNLIVPPMPEEEELRYIKRGRSYLEESVRLLQKRPNVSSVIVLGPKGHLLRTTIPMYETVRRYGMYTNLYEKASNLITEVAPADRMLMIRMRTEQHEVIMMPDGKLHFIVTQDVIEKPPNKILNEY